MEEPTDIQRIKVIDTDASYVSRNSASFPDGSTVTLALALDDTQDGENLPSKLFRYSAEGDFIWELDLPESLNEGWKVITLANGNVLVMGFTKDLFPEMAALALVSPDAQVLKEQTFIAQTSPSDFVVSRRSIDGIERKSSEIAVVVPVLSAVTETLVPRLLRFTSSLEMVSDEVYTDINASLNNQGRVSQIGIFEDDQAQIHLLGKLSSNEPEADSFVINITLDGETLDETNSYVTKGDVRKYPSGFSISNSNRAIWCTAHDTQDPNVFSMSGMDLYSVGSEISIFQTSSEVDSFPAISFSSFPGQAYIKSVKRTEDTGYILFGTCNIAGDQTFPSDYRILLVKLTRDLAIEWIQSPSLGLPTVATDIIETADGYLLSCTQFTFSELNKSVLIQTNKLGQF